MESGIWQKDGKRFITTVNEKPVWAKTIAKDPETYFTKEVLEAIDKVLARQYLYGITKTEDENFDELDGEEIDH